jgi:hypothetical protein
LKTISKHLSAIFNCLKTISSCVEIIFNRLKTSDNHLSAGIAALHVKIPPLQDATELCQLVCRVINHAMRLDATPTDNATITP